MHNLLDLQLLVSVRKFSEGGYVGVGVGFLVGVGVGVGEGLVVGGFGSGILLSHKLVFNLGFAAKFS